MSKVIVENLKKSYKNKLIYEGVNIDFDSENITCIAGLNGVGKTTLLKAICGAIDIDSGSVSLDGNKTIDKLNDILLIQDKIIIPQNMSIINAIKMFSTRNKRFDRSYVDTYLDFLNIDEQAVFSSLSKGNQEIIQMALLMANKPKFIFLDEPLAAVDIKKREFLYKQLIALNSDGVGIVISSHIIGEIQNIFTKVIILKEDKSILSMTLDQIYEAGFDDFEQYIKEVI